MPKTEFLVRHFAVVEDVCIVEADDRDEALEIAIENGEWKEISRDGQHTEVERLSEYLMTNPPKEL